MSKSKPGRLEYNERFSEVLAMLNPAQQKAVDQIDGPVLVIAGPGTGKTHILSARIGRILLDTDTQAANILCLTFTDAGVKAMRERLLGFIGPDAHRVPIYTFHSFCNNIIQENLINFGLQNLEPITELEKIDLIRSLMDKLPFENPLKRGKSQVYFFEKHLLHLFDLMKTEHWSPEHVQTQIDAYLKEIPTLEKYKYQRNTARFSKGDPKLNDLQKEHDRMAQLRAGVDLYSAYEGAKKRLQRYDFSDMILWVLDAFAKDEMLLRRYQEQFLYILVDEYQDTNGAQNRLIQLLASYWEVPNLFIVGDDDQSIYEFQGARLKNLLDLYKHYERNLELIILEENFRSTHSILSASQTLIEHNDIRVIQHLQDGQLEKKLLVGNPDRIDEDRPILLQEYPNRTQELVGLVKQIEDLIQQGTPATEIAVIYARHKQVAIFQDLLLRKGIPFQTRKRVDILNTPLFSKISQILSYLEQEIRLSYSGANHLFKLLHFDFLEIPPGDLAKLSYHLARSDDASIQWRQAIGNEQLLEKLGVSAKAQILQISASLEALIQDSVNLSLSRLLEKIFNTLNITAFVARQTERLEGTRILITLLNFVQELNRKDPLLPISDFLELLKRMLRNRIAMPVDTSLNTEEGIQLVTAHSAKGLEFDSVFLLDLTADPWGPQRKTGRSQFKLPDTLSYLAEEDAEEARRRLLYVAMTRAKRNLFLSYARTDDQGKLLDRLSFLDELLVAPELHFSKQEIDASELLDYQLLRLAPAPKIENPQLSKALIDDLLGNFKMSISALNTYLECSLSFYYSYLLKVPSLKSEAAAYGQAVHLALQRLFLSMQQSRPRNFPPRKIFIGFFESELQRLRHFFTDQSFQQYLKRGKHALGAYYQEHLGKWHKKVVVEYTVRNVEIDGIPVTGTIDKIEFLGQQAVNLVDYKTGIQQSGKMRPPTPKKPSGGNYWRQLVFYKLLYENFDQSGRLAKEGSIVYLDPNAQGELLEESLVFEAGETQVIRDLLKETYAKIQEHDFYTGCGKDTCKWCTFVREHTLPPQLSDPAIEELDD